MSSMRVNHRRAQSALRSGGSPSEKLKRSYARRRSDSGGARARGNSSPIQHIKRRGSDGGSCVEFDAARPVVRKTSLPTSVAKVIFNKSAHMRTASVPLLESKGAVDKLDALDSLLESSKEDWKEFDMADECVTNSTSLLPRDAYDSRLESPSASSVRDIAEPSFVAMDRTGRLRRIIFRVHAIVNHPRFEILVNFFIISEVLLFFLFIGNFNTREGVRLHGTHLARTLEVTVDAIFLVELLMRVLALCKTKEMLAHPSVGFFFDAT
jgi:hypothetical protein